jgi:hypothetical protein
MTRIKLTDEDFSIHKCTDTEWYYFISQKNPKEVIKQILEDYQFYENYDSCYLRANNDQLRDELQKYRDEIKELYDIHNEDVMSMDSLVMANEKLQAKVKELQKYKQELKEAQISGKIVVEELAKYKQFVESVKKKVYFYENFTPLYLIDHPEIKDEIVKNFKQLIEGLKQ